MATSSSVSERIHRESLTSDSDYDRALDDERRANMAVIPR
jgi:hypothetical protein